MDCEFCKRIEVGPPTAVPCSLLFRLHRHTPAVIATKIDDGILLGAADDSGARNSAPRTDNRPGRGTLRHKPLLLT
jgi:hypothetical protein